MEAQRKWLIRTQHNKIVGPLTKEKIVELVEGEKLNPNDELCSGNGYWFWFKEKDLVDKFIFGDTLQDYNPIREAESKLAQAGVALEQPHEMLNVKTTSPTDVKTNKIKEDDEEELLPVDSDLEYPSVSTNEIKEDDEEELLPVDSDLEYPDIEAITASIGEVEVKRSEVEQTSAPEEETGSFDLSQLQENSIDEDIEEEILLPEDDDLAYPDFSEISGVEEEDSTGEIDFDAMSETLSDITQEIDLKNTIAIDQQNPPKEDDLIEVDLDDINIEDGLDLDDLDDIEIDVGEDEIDFNVDIEEDSGEVPEALFVDEAEKFSPEVVIDTTEETIKEVAPVVPDSEIPKTPQSPLLDELDSLDDSLSFSVEERSTLETTVQDTEEAESKRTWDLLPDIREINDRIEDAVNSLAVIGKSSIGNYEEESPDDLPGKKVRSKKVGKKKRKKSRQVAAKGLIKRNDHYMMIILAIVVVLSFAGLYYYYTVILGKSVVRNLNLTVEKSFAQQTSNIEKKNLL